MGFVQNIIKLLNGEALHEIKNEIDKSKIDPSKIIIMEQHKGWGDNVYFTDFNRRRITGWLSPKPKKGDYLSCGMTSGRRMIFKVIEMDDTTGVPDMFFAKVKDVCYEDELKLEK